MRKSRAFTLPFAALPALIVAACVPAPAPTPTPSPSPAAASTPAAPPPAAISQPSYQNWLDAPQTAGDWTYRDGSGLSYATFGNQGTAALFGIECQKQAATIRLVRGSGAQGQVPLRIRTETADRLLTAQPDSAGRPLLIVSLPAHDPLLDAMALSRGRFAVETGGLETLYLPAWPEISRVIEDCR